MRISGMLSGAGALFPFLTTQAVGAQDPPVKVEVTTAPTHIVWYTDPIWIGIGVVAALLVIVLIVLAARSSRKSTTTVIR